MTQPTPQPMTIGVIAARFGVPTHRIAYVIRSRSIPAATRAGVVRLFDPAAVEEIGKHLAEIQQGSQARMESVGAP